MRITAATNAALPRITRVIESAPQTEIVIAQNITTSAPDAPMQLLDLAIQYARLRASWVKPYFKTQATSLYGAGNNTNTSAITGALDVVLAGETIANSHTMRTTNDVKAFLQAYSYQDMVLQDSPAAYYRLGESSGTTVADATGLNGIGSLSGSYTLGVAGAITGNQDTALQFGGAGYAALSNAIVLGNTFTLELCVKIPSSFSGYPRLLASARPADTTTGLELMLAPSTDTVLGYFNFADNNGVGGFGFGSGVITLNVWKHIALVYTPSSITVYLNGAQISQIIGTNGSIVPAINPLNLARNPGYNGDYASAIFDEVAIYSYALSASKVLTHYNVGMGAV